MSNYRPYFKFIRDFNIRMFLIILTIISVNISISVWASIGSDKPVIIYSSQLISMGILLCFLSGFFYSLTLFSNAMSIKADRVGYLKASLLWGIILSVGIAVFCIVVDAGFKAFIGSITDKLVQTNALIPSISIKSSKFILGLANVTLTNLFVFSLGFMIGAIWYRFKIIYNVIFFAGIPSALGAYIANSSTKSPVLLEVWGNRVLYNIGKFIDNKLLMVMTILTFIFLFILIGVRLLIKAPIKDYAHDLI